MPPIVAKLYRLLHRVRRDYLKAQIPLVGIVGFHEPPTFNPRTQLMIAFRSAPVSDAGGAASSAQGSGDGFRALRQAQQQLQVLRSTDEETREALRCWTQLCESWARRLQRCVNTVSSPTAYGNRTAAGPRPSLTGGSGTSHGSSSSANGVGVSRDGGDEGELPSQMQQLAAALEEGALLVEQLYDANHLSLEEFDADSEATEAEAEVEPAPAAGAVGQAATAPGAAAASGNLPDDGDLPAPLLVPSVAAARRQLDELAAAVSAAHPSLFTCLGGADRGGGSSGGGGGGGNSGGGSEGAGCAVGGDLLRLQLEAISEVLFHQRKFRHEPVEWVYDGLAPALLPQVLTRRRGIPLSLAVLYCSVARRLGVAAAPVKAAAGGGLSVSEGPATLHSLPPEVAARQAGRTVALAPPLDAWLVAAVASPPPPPPPAQSPKPTMEAGPVAAAAAGANGAVAMAAGASSAGGAEQKGESHGLSGGWARGELFVDVDRRGRVLEAAEARRRYADLPAAPLARLLPASPLELWCELSRVMVTAHGRRGESDLVAHWLVQVLALDHRSPEWRVMTGQ